MCLQFFLFILFNNKAKAQNNMFPSEGSNDTLTGFQCDSILEAVQGASLVDLGEAEHMKREYYVIKTQLIKSLISEKGYTVLAFEGSINAFERINNYINGNDTIDMKRFLYAANITNDSILHNLYYTKEIYDLINWIRIYNSSHPKKVSIVGFDFPNPTLLIQDINNQLTVVAKKTNTINDSLNYFIDNLNKIDHTYKNFYQNYMTYPKVMELFKQDSLIHPAKNSSEKVKEAKFLFKRKYSILNDSLINRLKVNLNALEALSVIFVDPNGAIERDKNMYENISYYRNLYNGEKIILWAHNGHLSERELIIGNGASFY